MQRASTVASGSAGHDSFLDVMANMVGILIILVVVVGLRVRNAPATPAAVEAPSASGDVERESAAEKSLNGDVLRAAQDVRILSEHIAVRFAERNRLAAAVAALEASLQQKHGALGTSAAEDLELARQTREAQAELERLQAQRLEAEQVQAPVVALENRPTPLGKTVDGEELHFQLRGARIVVVPIDDLVARFKADAERKAYRLRDQPEFSETVGPVGGFRLRYILERHDTSPEDALRSGRGGSWVRLQRWELLPSSSEMGETLDEALAPGSQFRGVLAGLRPQRVTVTLWTYPDSFLLFQRIKEELYRLGFAVAGRPLPEGILIGGSPQGSKSAAE